MKKPFSDKNGEVREITADDIGHFRPIQEVDPQIVEGMKRLRGQRGRQKAPLKGRLTVRFDHDIIAWFKRRGPGYQSRMNDALRDYIERH